jgi:phage gpG-like protein
MALNINIKTNVKNLQARYLKFSHKFPGIIKKGLEQAGLNLKDIILTKTDRGQKYTSGSFPAYSQAYASLKGKSTVDLQDTNKMLQSIDSKLVSRNKVQLYFRSGREAMKAYWHQTGQGNLPKRPFFGFNKKVERVIQKNFEKYIKKEIKRLQI